MLSKKFVGFEFLHRFFGSPLFGAWDFSVTNSVAYKSQIGNPVQNEPEEVGIKVFLKSSTFMRNIRGQCI